MQQVLYNSKNNFLEICDEIDDDIEVLQYLNLETCEIFLPMSNEKEEDKFMQILLSIKFENLDEGDNLDKVCNTVSNLVYYLRDCSILEKNIKLNINLESSNSNDDSLYFETNNFLLKNFTTRYEEEQQTFIMVQDLRIPMSDLKNSTFLKKYEKKVLT